MDVAARDIARELRSMVPRLCQGLFRADGQEGLGFTPTLFGRFRVRVQGFGFWGCLRLGVPGGGGVLVLSDLGCGFKPVWI